MATPLGLMETIRLGDLGIFWSISVSWSVNQILTQFSWTEGACSTLAVKARLRTVLLASCMSLSEIAQLLYKWRATHYCSHLAAA